MQKVTNKKFKKSSRQWMERHINDTYVKQSKEDGFRSRAAYKLLEINKKVKLFNNKNKIIADLGSAPGSWSQVIVDKAPKSTIIACDLIEMSPIERVHFIKGDFETEEVQQKIIEATNNIGFDLILSDMAPYMCGVRCADQAQIIRMAESALSFALRHGKPRSNMLLKVFSGAGVDEFIAECKKIFKKIKHLKPDASRKGSSEFYLYAECLIK
jgi:23S rRNA (uridine2552-2'-O)-methyltransferase